MRLLSAAVCLLRAHVEGCELYHRLFLYSGTTLVHLLECSLRADGSEIRAHKTVRLSSHLLQVDIISQLHVLGVDTQYLHTTSGIRDTNVNLAIKSTPRERERERENHSVSHKRAASTIFNVQTVHVQ